MAKLQKLRLIGYSKSRITRPYEKLTVGLNLLIFTLAFAITCLVKIKYSELVSKVWPNFEPVELFVTFFIGLGIFILLSAINVYIIRKKVR